MAGGDDDTTTGALKGNGDFGGRCRGQADVDNVESHAHERTAHHVAHHFARNTGVAANHHLAAEGAVHHLLAKRSVGRN